jgi:hypothetical protein
MHLTAGTEPTARRRLSKVTIRVVAYGRTCLRSNVVAPAVIEWSTSIFLSLVTNFLEWRRGKFHYYVIDGGAIFPPVDRLGCVHPRNDEVGNLDFEVVSSGALARGGDI